MGFQDSRSWPKWGFQALAPGIPTPFVLSVAPRQRSEVEGRKLFSFVPSGFEKRHFPQMIPMPLSTDSMMAAAMTEPIWPPALALMACISRWFFLL